MKKYWLAERAISLKEAQVLIEEQFPQLCPVTIQPIGEGWDNRVFQVNQRFTFRFPRRQVAVELLENEGHILPTIAPLLPYQIPVPQFYGQAASTFKWPFLGYSFIEGNTLSSVTLPRKQRQQLAQPLANFLKALHTIELDALSALNLPGDTIGRMDIPQRLENTSQRLQQARAFHLIEDHQTIEAIMASTPTQRTQPQACLVHGDFQGRQILIDQEHQLSGIIDWGDIHLGDPCLDLSILFSFLPEESITLFQETYGSIDRETLLLARFRALHLGLVLLLYGHDIHNQESFTEGQRILANCCESFNQGL